MIDIFTSEDMGNISLCIFQYLTLYYCILYIKLKIFYGKIMLKKCHNLEHGIIIQAGANALSCTIHITDSSPNANATIINPISLHQGHKILFS
jgi:hypothetical protein